MQALARTNSFGRRNRRAGSQGQRQPAGNGPGDSDEDDRPQRSMQAPPEDEDDGRSDGRSQAQKKGGVLGAIKRSASFSRRKNKNGEAYSHSP